MEFAEVAVSYFRGKGVYTDVTQEKSEPGEFGFGSNCVREY